MHLVIFSLPCQRLLLPLDIWQGHKAPERHLSWVLPVCRLSCVAFRGLREVVYVHLNLSKPVSPLDKRVSTSLASYPTSLTTSCNPNRPPKSFVSTCVAILQLSNGSGGCCPILGLAIGYLNRKLRIGSFLPLIRGMPCRMGTILPVLNVSVRKEKEVVDFPSKNHDLLH